MCVLIYNNSLAVLCGDEAVEKRTRKNEKEEGRRENLYKREGKREAKTQQKGIMHWSVSSIEAFVVSQMYHASFCFPLLAVVAPI